MADDKVHHGANPSTVNRLILAALGGTLTVTMVVTIISVVLSPARVTFRVTHASSTNRSGGIELALTVEARNPSRRCKAKYGGVVIDLVNGSSTAGTSSIHTKIADADAAALRAAGYVEGPNVTRINASVIVPASLSDVSSFITRLNDVGLTAVVRAFVRFKIGVARTRIFEMRVSCPKVVFPSAGAQQQVVECRG